VMSSFPDHGIIGSVLPEKNVISSFSLGSRGGSVAGGGSSVG
jgi:hypothetical protein